MTVQNGKGAVREHRTEKREQPFLKPGGCMQVASPSYHRHTVILTRRFITSCIHMVIVTMTPGRSTCTVLEVYDCIHVQPRGSTYLPSPPPPPPPHPPAQGPGVMYSWYMYLQNTTCTGPSFKRKEELDGQVQIRSHVHKNLGSVTHNVTWPHYTGPHPLRVCSCVEFAITRR